MDFSGGGSHVAVGVDGSPASYAALRRAVRQARRTCASPDVVGVHGAPGTTGRSAPPGDAAFDAEQATKAVSGEPGSVLPPSGEAAPVGQRVPGGDPAEVLIEASAGADRLLVGSRGRGGFASLLPGSVGRQRAVHASCPVVDVRADTTEAAGSADPTP